MRPIIINDFLHAARILADGCEKFRTFSVEGTELNRDRIAGYLNRSLMLVTALSPVIGYDEASAIAHPALRENTTLREAALATGAVTAAQFDRIVNPAAMVGTISAGNPSTGGTDNGSRSSHGTQREARHRRAS